MSEFCCKPGRIAKMNTQTIFNPVIVTILGMTYICHAGEGKWTRKSDMPTARSGLCASVVDGKVYAIGGGPSTGVVITTVEQYEPTTDTWTSKANMQFARGFLSTSVVNGKIYAIGGLSNSDNNLRHWRDSIVSRTCCFDGRGL